MKEKSFTCTGAAPPATFGVSRLSVTTMASRLAKLPGSEDSRWMTEPAESVSVEKVATPRLFPGARIPLVATVAEAAPAKVPAFWSVPPAATETVPVETVPVLSNLAPFRIEVVPRPVPAAPVWVKVPAVRTALAMLPALVALAPMRRKSARVPVALLETVPPIAVTRPLTVPTLATEPP